MADKKKLTPKIPNKKYKPENLNNRLVDPPRGKSLDGQAPTYSTMQIRNVNTNNEYENNNQVTGNTNAPHIRDNNSWMFENNNSTSTNTQTQICTITSTSSSSSQTSTPIGAGAEYLIKGELTTLVGLYVTGIVSKA